VCQNCLRRLEKLLTTKDEEASDDIAHEATEGNEASMTLVERASPEPVEESTAAAQDTFSEQETLRIVAALILHGAPARYAMQYVHTRS
jgi:hypothetical protein